MAAETVDTLELHIRSSASDAAEKVRQLSTSVSDFGKEVSRHVENVNSLAEAIERIVSAMEKMSSVKSLKTVLNGVSSTAAQMKEKSIGKAFKPIEPPMRARTTVKGKTRTVRFKDGSVRKFNTTSDEIAKELNGTLNGTTYNNSELSKEISAIRNKIIENDESAIQDIKKLADTLAGGAVAKTGASNVSSYIQYLNEVYGRSEFGVTDKDIAGFGEGLRSANQILKNAGARFRFAKWVNGGIRTTRDGQRALAVQRGVDEFENETGIGNPEDLLSAIRTISYRHNPRSSRLNELGVGSTEELSFNLFNDMVDKIYGSTEIKTPAESTKEAKQIAKEMDAAFKSQKKWNAEQNARYKEEYGGLNKKQQMNLAWQEEAREKNDYDAIYAQIDTVMDKMSNEYLAEEDRKYEAYMKQIAEGVVQDRSIGPEMDTQEFVDQVTGVSRAFSDAKEEALAFQKAIAEGVVQDAITPATEGIQEMTDRLNGIGRAAKSAKDSASDIAQSMGWNDDEKTAKHTQWEQEMEEIRAYGDRKKQAAAIEELRRSLADNTPELISARRNRAAQMGGLEKYDELFSSHVPQLADRGVAAGLIDENMRQAMIEAAGCADEMKEEVQEAADAATELSERTENASENAEEARSRFGSLRNVLIAISSAAKGSTIGKLGSRLMRVASMRALRYVVRGAASGLSEGISNMYQWSKISNGAFSTAMDTISTKSTLVKNSLATALSPAIEALVPVISRLVSWVNTASNAISQFMALLTGKSTWTKATESATEWGESTESAASGASGAIKDLLADWDELNVIQSESSSGSGGSGSNTGTSYADMFEESSTFDKWTEKFEDIKTIVTAIGAGIAAWFVASEVETFLGKLGIAGDRVTSIFNRIRSLATGGVLLAISFSLADDIGEDIAENGLTLENALAGVGDILAAGVGGYLVANSIIPGSGIIGTIAGITIAVAIGLSAYVTKKRSITYAKLAKDSFAKTGYGGFDTAKYKEAIENELNERIGDLSVSINAFETYGEAKQNLEDAAQSLQSLSEYVYGGHKLTEEQAEEFESNWEIVFNAVQQMHDSTWSTIEFGIAEAMKTESEEGAKHLKTLQAEMVELKRLTGGAEAAWKEEATQISGRIVSGTATEDDIQRYSVLMELIGNGDISKSLTTMGKWAETVNSFDFGSGADAVGNAVGFVNDMDGVYSDAIEEVELWEQTQKDAIDAAKNELEAYYRSGYIDEDQHNSGMSLLNEWDSIVDKKTAESKQEIQQMMEDTYGTIFQQVLRGFYVNDASGGNVDEYMEQTLPIRNALTAAGFNYPKEWEDYLANILTYGIGNISFTDIWNSATGQTTYGSIFPEVVRPLLRQYMGDSDFESFLSDLYIPDSIRDYFNSHGAIAATSATEEAYEFGSEAGETAGNEIANAIKEALDNGNFTSISDSEMTNLVNELVAQYSLDDVMNVIKEFYDVPNYLMNMWDDPNAKGSRVPEGAIGVMGRAGMSDVRYAGTEWYTEPSEPVRVDAAASGVALDSTVGTIGPSISGDISALGSLVEAANRILRSIETYSKATANKELTVNISPSTGFARTMGASSKRMTGVTGLVK